jgi:pimeloyl-ACP methyl ester carboxylesterase
MPIARSNGIDIEYEVIGPRGNRPLLLVMGLGTQMIHWDDALCAQLVAAGHQVIRFDNRDVGGSTKIDGDGMPNVLAAMAAASRGAAVDAPYRLSDMAADAAGLLDALDIEAAHVVGASLGGMIAQTLALEHPGRVRTLTSIMSSTGHPDLPTATPGAAAALFQPAPPDREGNIERAVRVFRAIGSPGFPFDETRVRERAARGYDRCFHPAGVARQMLAIVASGSRRDALRQLRVPTLVVHGADDPLVPLACGLDTAESIPGAELLIVEGMGHDLPRAAWPRLVDAVTQLTTRDAEG